MNHGGDSDSAGRVTGQLLGLTLGLAAIPERWLARVELRDLIETIAADLAALNAGTFDRDAHRKRYPGW